MGKAKSTKIWGISVPIGPSGRKIWPDSIKQIACKKVLAHGLSRGAVAKEIGTSDSVVARWVEDKLETSTGTAAPEFVEIVTGEQDTLSRSDQIHSEIIFRFQNIELVLTGPTSRQDLANVAQALSAAQ